MIGWTANLLLRPTNEVGQLTNLPRQLTNLQETLTIEVPLLANLLRSLTDLLGSLTNKVPRGTSEVGGGTDISTLFLLKTAYKSITVTNRSKSVSELYRCGETRMAFPLKETTIFSFINLFFNFSESI